jgi:eukaryotic-like serine/threonine-protein kinase
MIGETIAHYRITAKLGQGGMGEVYRATDTKLDREVALKILPPAFAADAGRMARFEREAKILASLNHPNIAAIYGVEERALVMELVDGASPQGPMAFEDAWKIALQMADALEYAHEKGVIHRDLKPANVKVTPEGVVKLLDFGLAKAFSGQDSDAQAEARATDSPTLTLGATVAGAIMGTAAYMPPEQAKGKKADKRADIWSWGVVLYELLTGDRMFKGDDVADTLAQVLTKEPDLERVPERVRRLLRRCLEKDPKRRLRDIGEARWLAEEGGAGSPAQAASLPHTGRRWAWPGVAGVLALGAAALAFVHFRESPPERQVLQYTLPAPEKARNVQQFAISPNGHYLVIRASGELWVRAMDSLQAQPLAGTDGAIYPFWSPDSRYIGFFADGKLKKISVNGGPAQPLCDANGRGGTWNNGGVILFGNLNVGIMRVPAAGGDSVPVTKPESVQHRNPTFLPDGRHFLYAATQGKENGVYLGSLDSKETRRIVPDPSVAEYFDGHILFVRGGTLMAQPVDPKSFEAKGDLFPVAPEQVSAGLNPGDYLFSASGNGVLIYQTGGSGTGQRHLWFDRAGKNLGAVGGTVRSQNTFALSPDGKRVVIEGVAQQSGNSDLWITDLEHSNRESRFTFDAYSNRNPVWSPDGSKVAFASSRGGVYNLYQRASNGTGQDELLFESKESKLPWDWSRDGRFIIFLVQGPKANDLWVLPVTADKKPFPLLQSEFNKFHGQLSPDGKWLAYASVESGHSEVYVVPFPPGPDSGAAKPPAGKWQVSTAGGAQPRWRGDGKELFYLALDGKLMAVEVKATAQSFDRGAPQALFDAHSDVAVTTAGAWGYAPAADGKRFLIATSAGERGEAPPLTVVVNWLAGVKK